MQNWIMHNLLTPEASNRIYRLIFASQNEEDNADILFNL